MDWLDLLAVQETLRSLLPTPQFKSINSSALSFLYSPTLTFIHDYLKNHYFFDIMVIDIDIRRLTAVASLVAEPGLEACRLQ